MSGDLVLDTSVVIAALRGVPGIEARLDQMERLWLPLIALGELELGVELASNAGAQRAALDAFLSAVAVLPLTTETARQYARLRGALKRAGTPIPENDLWIAALAVRTRLAGGDARCALRPRARPKRARLALTVFFL